MTPKKRLGRGLDALLSKPVAETAAVTGDAHEEDSGDGLRQIPVDLLQRGQYQPRVDIRQDTLEDLAASIKAQGVVQPIVCSSSLKQDIGHGSSSTDKRYSLRICGIVGG